MISYLDPGAFHQLTLLEELDLYDNKIKNVGEALDKLQNLTYVVSRFRTRFISAHRLWRHGDTLTLAATFDISTLDLSFNLLRSVPDCLEHLKSLNTIYFVQNKISKIASLNYSVALRSLELGGNRIRVRTYVLRLILVVPDASQKIEGLDALVNLEELWLGKNKITKLEGLSGLKKLKILSLQSNRITKLENLEELEELEQIYLSHNGIAKLEGLEHNVSTIPVTLFLKWYFG